MLFVAPGIAGGRVYCEGLLRGLAAVDGVHEYVIYTRRGTELSKLPADRFVQVRAPVSGGSAVWRTLWEYGILPRYVSRGGFQLFHGLGSLSPAIRTCPVVLTIHDLIYRHFPDSIPLGYRVFMGHVLPAVARRADRVIVPSRRTMEDVVGYLRVKEEQIRLVPYGPGNDLSRVTDCEDSNAVLKKYNLRQPYIISVSRAYPHKNLAGLLRALARLRSRGYQEVSLVLVGERYQGSHLLERLTHELGLSSCVVFTGYISNEEAAALYSAATLFAFPSLAEGFGLPILEAMTCGTPVVASNASAVPEAVGNAGVVADARNPDEFAAAISRVLDDVALQADLRQKGFDRVREFSWERNAQLTLDVYHELL
jgi:glycosyltransferase involved in cell wall biosynthesis